MSPSGTISPLHFAIKRAREVMATVERYGVLKVTWRNEGGKKIFLFDSFGFRIRIILTDFGKVCSLILFIMILFWISSKSITISRPSHFLASASAR